MNDIFRLTALIQQDFPELYKNLNETPSIISDPEKEITANDITYYYNALKWQLNGYEKTHSVKRLRNSGSAEPASHLR